MNMEMFFFQSKLTKDNKWVARISVSGVEHHLGSFVTKEEAIAARIDGEKQYFKPILDKYR